MSQCQSATIAEKPVNSYRKNLLGSETVKKSEGHKHNQKCFDLEVVLASISIYFEILKESNSCLSVGSHTSNLSTPCTDESSSPLSYSDNLQNSNSSLNPASTNDTSDNCHDGRCVHIPHFISACRLYFKQSDFYCSNTPKFDQPFYDSLKRVLQLFKIKYEAEKANWLQESVEVINGYDIMAAKSNLTTLFDSIYDQYISWGRIISMLGFVSELCIHGLLMGKNENVKEYISFTVQYIDTYLWTWILRNDGWRGLENFPNQGNQAGRNRDFDDVFSGFTRLARLTAFALAGMAICKYVADKI